MPVRPHHLVFDEDDADAIGALAARGAPPCSAAEIETLRQAPAAGEILRIASARSPVPADMTEGEDMFAVWGGIAGARTMPATSPTDGPRHGRIAAAAAVTR